MLRPPPTGNDAMAQPPERIAPSPQRALLAAAGWFFFALGAVGLVLPGLPTTVFWIVAAWLWMRSDPQRLRWLLDKPGYGETIRRFLERGEMRRRDKRVALLAMLAGYAICLLVWSSLAVALALGAVMGLTALWIWRRPESPPVDTEEY